MNKFTSFTIVFVSLLAVGIGYLAANSKLETTQTTQKDLAADVTDADHTVGSSTARVTLVEYGDFQCPACALYYPLVEQVRKGYGDNLRLVFRQFPLRTNHKNAQPAAEASEAAALQGKFWEMHGLLYEHQTDWSDAADPKTFFTQYAASLALDLNKFSSDMASDAVKARIERDVVSGNSSGVNGTPSFYLNGKKIQSPKSPGEFKNLIDQAFNASS